MIARIGNRLHHALLIATAIVAVLAGALLAVSPAAAAGAAPYWRLESRPAPTKLPLEEKGTPGDGVIDVTAANLGDTDVRGEAAGKEVKITDTLPAGVEATEVLAESKATSVSQERNLLPGHGGNNPNGLSCTAAPVNPVVCTFKSSLPPFEQLEIFIRVKVKVTTATTLSNDVTVEGGGANHTSLEGPESALPVGKPQGAAEPFGIERYEQTPETEAGALDMQAGSHPYQLTTTLDFNQTLGLEPEEHRIVPMAPALDKNLSFKLPPGLIGDVNAVPQCSDVDFGRALPGEVDTCPAEDAIGVAEVTFFDPLFLHFQKKIVPVFNLAPAPGEPARFGFVIATVPIVINTAVRSGSDYGVNVSVEDTSEAVQLLGSRVTLWGVPQEASHSPSRGWNCLEYQGDPEPCDKQVEVAKPTAFLSLPTACNNPQPATSVTGESWPDEAGEVSPIEEGAPNTEYKFPSAFTECGTLGFTGAAAPSVSVYPVEDHGAGWTAAEQKEEEEGHAPAAENTAANTPTGLRVHVHVPQTTTFEPDGRAEPAVKDTTLTFPAGIMLSPSAANGLQACAEGEGEGNGGIGFTGVKLLEDEFVPDTFTDELRESLEPGKTLEAGKLASCPDASKVGVVRIKSPDLAHELEGGVYLAKQSANPFGSLFAMYIIAQEPVSKVFVKLAGKVSVSATGQITSTFEDTPDAPFEDLRLELFSGPRASLSTPAACGTYGETEASFTPWSGNSKEPGTVKLGPTQPFEITSCPSPLPFSPSFTAGSTNNQAGAFTPFTLTIGVPQEDGALKTISNMQLPPGLAALLASVPLCPEPQAEEGTCGEESLIGHSTSSSGLGSDPVTLPGTVYLTGPYDGAPFGLSAVTEAKAGPFDLGRVVVRSGISVNPYTAAASINTEAARFISYTGAVTELAGFPEFIEGVPSQIKQLNVTVDRPNFEFNPTNCSPMEITATLKASDGEAAKSAPFQASNCASLPFKPTFTATVVGQGSKEDGTTFDLTVESPGLGQANIHKVDLTIPAVLPSRLSTIQKACPDAVFNANPASCDEGSLIGEGIVHTPVFKNPLRGPAYLVSHGSAEFPDVEFVLQGEGVTIVIDAKTDIKHGITYSKLETAPDAPFTKFEAIFPAGPHSALTPSVPEDENYNLCKTSLSVPTELTAQNGAFISETTNVEVTGCHGQKGFKVVLTRAQLLARELKTCRTKYKAKSKKSKRLACERKARKKYGPKHHAKKSTKGKKKT